MPATRLPLAPAGTRQSGYTVQQQARAKTAGGYCSLSRPDHAAPNQQLIVHAQVVFSCCGAPDSRAGPVSACFSVSASGLSSSPLPANPLLATHPRSLVGPPPPPSTATACYDSTMYDMTTVHDYRGVPSCQASPLSLSCPTGAEWAGV